MGGGFGVVGLARLSWLAGFRDEERVTSPLFLDVQKGQSATELDIKVLDAYMADGMAFHTSYQTSVATVGIGDMHVTDADTIDC